MIAGLARLIVRASAWLVPRDMRAEWRDEWLAEVPAGGGAAVAFACGAPWHAAWLQKEQWRPDMVMADVRSGWRQVRRRPGMAGMAAATLAIGIGATLAVFSVAYGVLLKPLPYREPGRLVQLWEVNPLFNWTEANVAPGNLLSWQARTLSFESYAYYFGSDSRNAGVTTVSLDTGSEPQRVRLMSVSTSFFDVLGVTPAAGRFFLSDDTLEGRGRILVLSDAFWRRQFNRDPGVLSRGVVLNGRTYAVAGVAPAGFTFDQSEADAWVPLILNWSQLAEVRRPHYLRVIARLRPGVTLDAARADLLAVASALEKEHPDTNTQMSAGLGPLDDWFTGPARRPLTAFLFAVVLVLLIACVNVANLFLTRASERTQEMRVRAALGANRLRLIRQLLAEASVVAVAGTGLGALAAAGAVRLFQRYAPPGVPRLEVIGLNLPVALAAVVLVVLTTLLVGVLPALSAARSGARHLGSLRGVTRATGRSRWLVASEVALAVILVVGASMAWRSFAALAAVPPGFAVDGIVSAKVSLPGVRYGEDGQSARFFEQLAARLRAQPGVVGAGATTRLPLEGVTWTGQLFLESRPEVHGREIRHKTVTLGYLEALGLPVLEGRLLTQADWATGQRPIVVNAALARKYFPGGGAVGQRVAFDAPTGAETRWRTIMGVVGDEPQDGLGAPAVPEMYEPQAQRDESEMAVLVRASMPAAEAQALLRRVVYEMDAQLAVYESRTMQDGVARSMARERLAAWLSAALAVAALVLAAVGIFGVTAAGVAARTREFGVRLALGATRAAVLRLVLRDELAAVGAGLVIGTIAAVSMARVVASLLFGVTASDPASYAAGIGILAVVAVAAGLWPARRAASLDPVETLRHD